MKEFSQITLRIGPANYAGQADSWAKASSRELGIAATSFSYRAKPWFFGSGPAFVFPSDHTLPHPRTQTSLGRRLRRKKIGQSSHLLLDGFVPVTVGPSFGIDADLKYFGSRGAKTALIAHGSDIRLPSAHQNWFPESYFNHAPKAWTDIMSKQATRNLETLEQFPAIPLFVSTPDLLLHAPTAKWLPLTIDMPAAIPVRREGPPTILHIPSRRNPPIKGTAFIEPVLRAMENEGLIRVISPDSVSHTRMLDLMAQSDIVIDQLLTGSYGVTAVEAMSLGSVVVGNVHNLVRDQMPQSPPIVDATPRSLDSILRHLIADDLRSLGLAGRRFAETWHDGRAAAQTIASWL